MNIKTEPDSVPDSLELELCVQKICWNCNYCNKVYASKSNLNVHIRTMHIAAKCAICGVIFPSISLWRKHHNDEHSNHAAQCRIQVDGIGQKSNEHSKIAQIEPRKLNEPVTSSKKMTKRDLEGEVFI